MADDVGNPGRQFSAAWQAAAAALDEWRQQVAAATAEARGKIDPAVRAAMEAGPRRLYRRVASLSLRVRHGPPR